LNWKRICKCREKGILGEKWQGNKFRIVWEQTHGTKPTFYIVGGGRVPTARKRRTKKRVGEGARLGKRKTEE